MIIAASIVTVLVTLVVAITAIICVQINSSYRYGNTARLEEIETQLAAWAAVKRADPKELHERLVALENKAGIMIGNRR